MERFSPAPTFTEYLQGANSTLVTIVQIETQEALDSVKDIAAVDGIDVLFIGPFDLGNNIGHPILDGVVEQELKDAMAKILKASHDNGKKCGVFSVSGEQAKMFAEQGFDMIAAATDYTVLDFSLRHQLSVAKSAAPPQPGKGY
jgi:4-hydroxy-2-oxoheptanedioate aldolase